MKLEIKSFLNDTVIYGAGELLTRSVQILVLPLVFIYLTPEQFGVLDYFLSAKLLLTSFLGWGIITALLRYGSGFSGFDFKEVMTSGLVSVILVVGLFIGFAAVFSESITVLLLGSENTTAFNLTIITSGIYALRSVTQGLLRLKRQPSLFLISNFIDIFFYIGFSFLFLSFTSLNYLSFLVANLISITLSFLTSMIITRCYFVFRFSPVLVKKLLVFGTSILFTSITFIFLQTSGRFFLKMYNGFEQLAVLGMSTRFSLVVGSFLIAPFTLAWLPFVNTIYKTEPFHVITNKIFSGFTFAGIFLSVGLIAFSSDILILIGQEAYLSSYLYIPFYCLSYIFLGYYYFFSAGIYLTENQKMYYVIASIVLAFNIGVSFLFVKYLTVLWVSIISMASHLLLFLLARTFGKSVMQIHILSRRNIKIWIIGLFFLSLVFGLNQLAVSVNDLILLKVGLMILFPVAAFYVGIIEPDEIAVIKTKLRLSRK